MSKEEKRRHVFVGFKNGGTGIMNPKVAERLLDSGEANTSKELTDGELAQRVQELQTYERKRLERVKK